MTRNDRNAGCGSGASRDRSGLTPLLQIALIIWSAQALAAEPPPVPDADKVQLTWGVKIPLRDGVKLDATVYRPKDQKKPAPCVFTLTPYIAQSYSDRGIYFAAHGYPFLTIDVRGRGNSEGEFRPFIQEAHDGHDVVEWLAKQPYCNGKVAMWGGSYAGYDQWATAKELPPHLATIVPAASAQAGVDFPMFANIFFPYESQWLTLVTGRASQDKLFGNRDYWMAKNREWFEAGASLRDLEKFTGIPHAVFQQDLDHPMQGPHWDAYNPTKEQYARLSLPILSITGHYDGDQPGAMAFYKQHMQHGSAKAKAQHYLIIGPWDHAGTRTPKADVGGLKFGEASLVDLPLLHTEWYAWTMSAGKKPQFLKKRVAYYVMVADEWRYADTLEAVTAESRPFYLDSAGGVADSVFQSGSLGAKTGIGAPDHYIYDPRDRSVAALEATVDPESLLDQRLIVGAGRERLLVYHTAPFEKDTEVSGFFKLSAWLAIDTRDTDFAATVYEILADGTSVRLTGDAQRARYRESLREAKLVPKGEVLRYDFDRFLFTSRLIKKGSRLRLVIGPINSINAEKNWNAGGVVAEESIKDARTVTVQLYHDAQHPSALYVPIGAKP
jgi:putative CocE/NonD family hydrolase